MYDDVLIVTDESERGRKATEHGLAIAEQFGATVHALSVSEYIDKRDRMRTDADAEAASAVRTVAEQARDRGIEVSTAIREGVAQDEILACIDERDADIAVMGTRGLSGFRRLVSGSVTEYVIRQATIPVVAIRAPDAL